MFGKSLSEYIRFQWAILAFLCAVGLARLGLSLMGLPDQSVRWLAMTAVALAGTVYYGVRVHTSGFGSYKQLLPLVTTQNVLAHSIAIVGILLAMAGLPNIFAAPEYSGAFVRMQWAHALAHVVVGMGVFSLVAWGVASLVLLITKKLAPRGA